jgi:hypothetical protein
MGTRQPGSCGGAIRLTGGLHSRNLIGRSKTNCLFTKHHDPVTLFPPQLIQKKGEKKIRTALVAVPILSEESRLGFLPGHLGRLKKLVFS